MGGQARLVQVAAEVLGVVSMMVRGSASWRPLTTGRRWPRSSWPRWGVCNIRACSSAASIVEYLKVRELLLVLDNCEQLLDDAGDFAAAVVQGCPKVSVLATSREALDVPGERVMLFCSLATPQRVGSDAELMEIASVQLFRDRARAVAADLAWDERQWNAVGEICQRVDGIPLAIELAAGADGVDEPDRHRWPSR